MHASKGRDPKQMVAYIDRDGRAEDFGWFELRHLSASIQEATGGDKTVFHRYHIVGDTD